MKKIGKKVIEKIKKNNIRQLSPIFFAVKNIGIWFLLSITVIVGAFSIASLFFRLSNSVFSSSYVILLKTIFSLWIILIFISMILAYWLFRDTERGYKFSLLKTLVIQIGISVVLAVIFFFIGLGYVGESIALKIKGFDNAEQAYLHQWHQPKNGLLAGRLFIVDEYNISLSGVDGVGYIIDVSGLGNVELPTNIPVRLIVVPLQDEVFYVCRLLPAGFRGGFNREATFAFRQNEIIENEERNNICEGIPSINN